MKCKKILLPFIVLSIIGCALFIGGAAAVGKKVKLSIICDEITLPQKDYVLDFFTVAKVKIIYGGDYERLSQNEYSGNDKECLRHLNNDLCADIENLADRIYRDKSDAECGFDSGAFRYRDEEPGRYIDVDRLCRMIVERLDKEAVVEISSDPIYPEITVEELMANTKLLSEFSTVVKGTENRKKNVALSLSKINNTVVQAGDRFSFNETVGERTEANGFLIAHVIKDGEFVDGVGGGVCQASTTVYNAWLRSGLAVEKATAHSLPVSYVPPSLDAMVSESSDLILRNDSDYPIYIWARCIGNEAFVSLYGRPSEYEVKTRSVTIKTLPSKYEIVDEEVEWCEDESERILKRAKDGLVSESYRDYYKDGILVKTEKLRRNEYRAQDGAKAIRQEASVG